MPYYPPATTGAGTGDVVGPASATDNALTRFDTTTGKLVQNSPTTLDDNGSITFPASQGIIHNNAGHVIENSSTRLDVGFYSDAGAGFEIYKYSDASKPGRFSIIFAGSTSQGLVNFVQADGAGGFNTRFQCDYLGNTAVTGSLTTSSASGGIGYATGAGGTVTQATSKSTGVTLNKTTGEIVMNGAALAAATIVTFTLTNSSIAAGDIIVCNHVTTGTFGAYTINARAAAGSASVAVRNNSAGSLSEAVVIRFAVIKSVTA